MHKYKELLSALKNVDQRRLEKANLKGVKSKESLRSIRSSTNADIFIHFSPLVWDSGQLELWLSGSKF